MQYYETNERLIDDKVKRSPRGRYHALTTYLPREEIERVLRHYSDYIVGALYILHDKDILDKDVEEKGGVLLNDDGKPLKPPHWHILLKTFDATTENAVRKYFYRFRITEKVINDDGTQEEKLVSTLNQLVDSVGGSRDYLTHENDPDKYHYPKSDVQVFGSGWETFQHASRSADTALEIVEQLQHNCSLRKMVRMHGKDFVYHYRAYVEMARAIYQQEISAQSYVDLAQVAYSVGTDVITTRDFNGKKQIDPRKYLQAAEICSEFENQFMLYQE